MSLSRPRLSIVAFAVVAGHAVSGMAAPLMFERDVRPLLKTHCFHCHGEEKEIKGGLDLRLKHLIEKGGETGPALVVGKPHASLLIEQIKSGDMPKGDKKLSPKEIALLEQWITEGARTLRSEPETLAPGPVITEEERGYWAFRPIRNPPVPVLSPHVGSDRQAVDAFLLDRLQKAGLAFAPEADKATLIRRATFDLTGLPPTANEVAAFLADARPDAYELLVDRLLKSSRYGERWGRHWLDVAGYADSEGYNDDDADRTDAWRYRDYVIAAFNEDKPFDQFIQEQLAGDEMVAAAGTKGDLTADQIEKLTATGFLRMAPDGTGTEKMDPDLAKNTTVTETVKIISSSLLGMTVGCAECHDHRFDPILQRDFYRLRAVLEPALNWKAWLPPARRQVTLLTVRQKADSAELEKEARAVEAVLQAKYVEYRDWIFEREVEALPQDIRATCREAGLRYQKEPGKLDPEQKKLVDAYPGLKVSASPGILNLFLDKYGRDKEMKDLQDENARQAAAIRTRKPKDAFVRALTEPLNTPPPVTNLFQRGNRATPGEEILPGDLTVISPDHPVDFASDDPALPTTGRRLALARHLTSGRHPLVARVLVNRFWMHHFGRGLVNTPGDFGRQGELPTHPELLDWLASDFMTQGWSLKKFHKLVMTSAAYRQQSGHRAGGDQRDPGNTLLWRYPVQRLAAETIRDAVLAACGTLNVQPGGPPVPVSVDANNQCVVGASAAPSADGQEYRRSVYVTQKRSLPAQVLAVFDAPQMEPNCELRNASTVAPQSLLLMNSAFIVDQAEKLSKRVISESGGQDQRAQVQSVWAHVFGNQPSAGELDELAAYLVRQTELLRHAQGAGGKPGVISTQALASLCQALLGSNRFLYLD